MVVWGHREARETGASRATACHRATVPPRASSRTLLLQELPNLNNVRAAVA